MTSDEIWRTYIRTELDNKRPVYYAGSGAAGGHAFVCDGYDASNPTKFHFNWGWSGSNNGYFALSALNTTNGSFNEFNRIIIGIKPRTAPDYVCRIASPADNEKFNPGTDISVNLNTIKGNTIKAYLYIDGTLSDSSSSAPFSFTVKTSGFSAGQHQISVKGINGADASGWDSHQVAVNILSDCWQLQPFTFSMDSISIEQIFPVNENVVWAVMRDYSSKNLSGRKFIKTSNGGTTWTEGTINCPTCNSLDISGIYAFSDTKAYACLNPGQGTGGAILKTEDGGNTWTLQSTAPFTGSWANWVHFFDENNGVCMGDSYKAMFNTNYQFCIYTTNNGGTTWNKVTTANLPEALSNEAGTVNFYDAVGSTIWFGTGNGRVYKSTDKGLTWTVKDGVLGAVQTNVRFRDANNGFAFGGFGTADFGLMRTKDGGTTWTKVEPTGNLAGQDFEFVAGTDSTWINTGLFSAISITDNASFFPLDYTIPFRTSKFVSPSVGWGGGYYSVKGGGGIYKWKGSMTPTSSYHTAVRVKDTAGNPLQGATVVLNNQMKTSDDKGLSAFVTQAFGNPDYYKVSKTGYSTVAGNYFYKRQRHH
ncbi:MAG: hypothetical protein HC905_26710 [Bacteroidales bacterium]|nr:hypothetical protein [Bacteroidales bacterium]